MEMVVTRSVLPVFKVLKDGITEPEPDASVVPEPVTVHLKLTVLPLKGAALCDGVNEGMFVPVHTTISSTGLMAIKGRTVTVKAPGLPAQATLFDVYTGITVILLITGTFGSSLLMVVNDGIFPDPEVASPVEGLLLVQL